METAESDSWQEDENSGCECKRVLSETGYGGKAPSREAPEPGLCGRLWSSTAGGLEEPTGQGPEPSSVLPLPRGEAGETPEAPQP